MPSITGLSGQLFDTVGLEIEGTLMNRDEMCGNFMTSLAKLMGNKFPKVSMDHDASTESYAETLRIGNKTLRISQHTSAYKVLSVVGSGNSLLYGYEFKTTPLEIKELDKVLYPLMFHLYEYGDVISDRTSIHVHVGFANNFRMLKSLLTMMLSLEPVLYRLGGMGGTFRGHLNNAAYCRPLLNSCVVPISKLSNTKTYAQVLNPLAARDSRNIEQFWASMGVDYNSTSQHKYHSSRYAGMNFFSLYSHGTVEWRYFNKSFDVPLVISIAKLMRAIIETSSLATKRDLSRYDVIDSSQEISTKDAEEILKMTLQLCHEKEVDHIPTDNEMSHILEILKESHFSSLPETPTITHIKDFSVSSSLVEKGNLKIVEEFLPTNYVDIHNIKLMSIFT